MPRKLPRKLIKHGHRGLGVGLGLPRGEHAHQLAALLRRAAGLQGAFPPLGGRARLADIVIEPGDAFGENGALASHRMRQQLAQDGLRWAFLQQLEIGLLPEIPFQNGIALRTMRRLQFRLTAAKRAVQGISHHHRLPRKHRLGRHRGLAHRGPVVCETLHEGANVRRHLEIGLLNASHGHRGALGQQRPEPVVVREPDPVGAVRMQVIGDRPRHELHHRQPERPVERRRIPPRVHRHLGEGLRDAERLRQDIDHGFESMTARHGCHIGHPQIAQHVGAAGEAAHVHVGTTVQSVPLGNQRLVDQSVGNRHRRPVDSCDHEHAIGRMNHREVGQSVHRVADRTPGAGASGDGQQGEFPVHRPLVPLQMGGQVLVDFVEVIGVVVGIVRDPIRNAPAQDQISNLRGNRPIKHASRPARPRRLQIGHEGDEIPLAELADQVVLDQSFVIRPRDVVSHRHVDADDLRRRNAAFSRVVLRHRFRVGGMQRIDHRHLGRLIGPGGRIGGHHHVAQHPSDPGHDRQQPASIRMEEWTHQTLAGLALPESRAGR